MVLEKVVSQVAGIVQAVIEHVEGRVKVRTKPTLDSLIGGTAADLVKSKRELVAENAFLRQQLIVMKRQVAQPRLTSKDRGLLVMLSSRVRDWKNARNCSGVGEAGGNKRGTLKS